ncbi:Cleavage inducible protein [Phytophthora megakarya]|uniref:Cleavage inducible protein n=1 Tax=Phytophthora megakarya TaxID=4795 RepID=A0A225W4I4_9STRA|nr:Cleavage inducible protein [Phytophthora megakarya]
MNKQNRRTHSVKVVKKPLNCIVYFTKARLTWRAVHARYQENIKRANEDARVLSYSLFTQYIHFYFPGVRLTRPADDVCDCCVRLDVELQNPNITRDEI